MWKRLLAPALVAATWLVATDLMPASWGTAVVPDARLRSARGGGFTCFSHVPCITSTAKTAFTCPKPGGVLCGGAACTLFICSTACNDTATDKVCGAAVLGPGWNCVATPAKTCKNQACECVKGFCTRPGATTSNPPCGSTTDCVEK